MFEKYRERIRQRFSTPFWVGFFRGLCSVSEVLGDGLRRTTGSTFQRTARYKPLKPLTVKEALKKDREAIRGDFEKVCGDLRRVTNRATANCANVTPFPKKEKNEKR